MALRRKTKPSLKEQKGLGYLMHLKNDLRIGLLNIFKKGGYICWN